MKRSKRLRTNLAILGLRLWIGLNLAFVHGLPKLQDPDTFLADAMLQRFVWPEQLGWVAMISLFAGGLLLTVGLLTRTAATFLLVTLLAAAFIALPDASGMDRELALTYAVGLAVLLAHGPGALSADELIERKRRSRSPW